VLEEIKGSIAQVSWDVNVSEDAANSMRGAEKTIQKAVRRIIDRLASSENPRFFGKLLRHKLAGFYRAKVRKDWRIIYAVSEARHSVDVIYFGHRSSVYENL